MDNALDVACDVLEQDGHNEAVQLLRLLKGKTKTELQAAVRAVQFALAPEQEGPLDPRSPEGMAAALEGALALMPAPSTLDRLVAECDVRPEAISVSVERGSGEHLSVTVHSEREAQRVEQWARQNLGGRSWSLVRDYPEDGFVPLRSGRQDMITGPWSHFDYGKRTAEDACPCPRCFGGQTTRRSSMSFEPRHPAVRASDGATFEEAQAEVCTRCGRVRADMPPFEICLDAPCEPHLERQHDFQAPPSPSPGHEEG